MKIFVTGCTGYIGSNTCAELLNNGYEVVGINRVNKRNEDVINFIQNITGKDISFYEGDLRDPFVLNEIFKNHKIDFVIDMASSKGVGPSMKNPFAYYNNNIGGPLMLLEIMRNYDVNNYIYGSSSAVYGSESIVPIKEDGESMPSNPYGKSKLFVEQILKDTVSSDQKLNARVIRLFNPLGAHETGLLGDSLDGGVGNILSYLCRKVSNNEEFIVNGNDYNTPDGTCLRDYIHVSDVARAYRLTIEEMMKNNNQFDVYNIGSGKGTSIQELINAFIKDNMINPNICYGPSRPGDVPISFADTSKAKEKLGFVCEKNIDDMVISAWQRECVIQNRNNSRGK